MSWRRRRATYYALNWIFMGTLIWQELNLDCIRNPGAQIRWSCEVIVVFKAIFYFWCSRKFMWIYEEQFWKDCGRYNLCLLGMRKCFFIVLVAWQDSMKRARRQAWGGMTLFNGEDIGVNTFSWFVGKNIGILCYSWQHSYCKQWKHLVSFWKIISSSIFPVYNMKNGNMEIIFSSSIILKNFKSLHSKKWISFPNSTKTS